MDLCVRPTSNPLYHLGQVIEPLWASSPLLSTSGLIKKIIFFICFLYSNSKCSETGIVSLCTHLILLGLFYNTK